MRVLAVYQAGRRGWGKRIVDFIEENRPTDWEVASYRMPFPLPAIIDESEPFLPRGLPVVDLLLVLTEDTGLGQLVPDLAELAAAPAVIVPVDNEEWLPRGLMNQIKGKLESVVFPKPFCSLNIQEGRHENINKFAQYFGRPSVELNHEDGQIEEITIKRECPCGSTRYLKENLAGIKLEQAGEKGGLYHQLYPCLASVELIHASAHISATAIEHAAERL